MKKAKELAQAIKMIAGGTEIVIATVVSVDKTNCSCDVDWDGNEFGNVRLQSIIKTDTKGCKIFPAIGSKVLVEQINENGDWMVCMVSEVEEVLNEIGTSLFKMNSDGYVIKKGTDNLRDVVDDLMGQVKALNEQLQAVVVVIGVTPNIAALQAINVQLQNNRDKAKRILK